MMTRREHNIATLENPNAWNTHKSSRTAIRIVTDPDLNRGVYPGVLGDAICRLIDAANDSGNRVHRDGIYLSQVFAVAHPGTPLWDRLDDTTRSRILTAAALQ